MEVLQLLAESQRQAGQAFYIKPRGRIQRLNVTVRELQAEIPNAFHTTLSSALEQLFEKGLLNRVLDGQAHRYSLPQPAQDMGRAAAKGAIRDLLASSDSPTLTLSLLVEELGRYDARLLKELQQLIHKKLRENGKAR